ncbi:hypothetical protein HWV62_33349 [Athelia sp. TMB]|nr:hypothetical protein HWV62_33349 [Athelia sp. TMB]
MRPAPQCPLAASRQHASMGRDPKHLECRVAVFPVSRVERPPRVMRAVRQDTVLVSLVRSDGIEAPELDSARSSSRVSGARV